MPLHMGVMGRLGGWGNVEWGRELGETYAQAPGAQLREDDPARRRDEDDDDDGDDDAAGRVDHFRVLPASTRNATRPLALGVRSDCAPLSQAVAQLTTARRPRNVE